MAVRRNFNYYDVKARMQEKAELIKQLAIKRFTVAAEHFVANARQNHTYTDRTGNLTHSIGYVILNDGVPVGDNFSEGVGGSTARQVATDAARAFPKGIVLIVVAGMGYAAYVESKNYDVLTASSITAESEIHASLKQLQDNINAMK